jgi:UDP-2,3-diacylglucosamine hydrolase
MIASGTDRPVAILAGGGELPPLIAAAARRDGRAAIVFAIQGEANPNAFERGSVHVVRWGEIGRMFRLAEEAGCREAVFIGSISKRPDFKALTPDLGTIKLIPRILQLMQRSDGNLLDGVTRIFEEKGISVVSPLAIAPELALPAGCLTGEVSADSARDIEVALNAALDVGKRDIAQGAIAIAGEIVAIEDFHGTDAMLDRVVRLRKDGAAPANGGALVKCLKSSQDGRHDLPTIGPGTAERAQAAGLSGVAAEAGRAILVGREETVEAFRRAGLFLMGLAPATHSKHG